MRRSLFDLGGLVYDLQDLLGCPVDVVTERGLRPRMRERVLREGVELSKQLDTAPGETDLPAGLAQPARRALIGAGYTRLEQLNGVSEADLRRLHGIGPKAIGQLLEALEARGMAFAGE